LAVSLIKLLGYEPNVDIPIEITGLRPGEKLYEEILMSEEGLTSTKHNKIFITEPMSITMEELEEKLGGVGGGGGGGGDENSEVKRYIKEIVPTFKEPEEVNNKGKEK
jgi:hypothetical protein